jgi:hypothetical protein
VASGYLHRQDFHLLERQLASLHRHTQVRDAIDSARLLEFDVREGWAPLCRILEVPIPDEPFPRLNDTATTQAMIRMCVNQFARLKLVYFGQIA